MMVVVMWNQHALSECRYRHQHTHARQENRLYPRHDSTFAFLSADKNTTVRSISFDVKNLQKVPTF